MSLKGVSREEAEAYLGALSGASTAGEEDARGKLSQATTLVRLAEGTVDLFHDPVLKTYGRVLIGDHREVSPTRSTAFRRWLMRMDAWMISSIHLPKRVLHLPLPAQRKIDYLFWII